MIRELEQNQRLFNQKFNGLYECCCCGRTWREWYASSAMELYESMNRHEEWLGHRVHYVDQPRMSG